MGFAPYPFQRLPRVTRAEAALSRRAARVLPLARLDDAARALEAAVGTGATLRPAPLETCPAGALAECLADPLVAVLLRAASPLRGPLVALELDPRLAECLVDRALGGAAGASVGHRMGALDTTSRGVLAHVVARALAALGGGLRVADVVTTPAGLAAAIGDDGHVVWPAALRIGDDEGTLRAWLPDAVLARVPAPPRALSPHAGALPVTLVADVGRAALRASDLRALAPGDVLVLDEASARREGDALRGEARVHAAGTGERPRTVFHCVLADGTLRVARVEQSEEPAMTEGEKKDGETDVALGAARVGDAPVELRVELARFSLRLDDVAALRTGEVLRTGRAVGEAVTLRAGDRAIATGELVDVDGEVGVRILRLAP